ncbi:MAG: Mrp/NBP35 family ATP-binding protein [Lachnospiraceae bacterium]|nr:Mrp/NBP35 family ATP-binding protein [Lachnospiraceae bacterium]MBR5789691.1 Mrp/NBP35 family ATP-binding protein [Lachnospiraceae bacterium]
MAEEKQCASAGTCGRESCEGCPSANGGEKPDFTEELNAYSSVKHVIGIVSGKGGVGKSFVTAAMASAMRKKGYEVGILDADITGPSIPKMFGVKGPTTGNEMGIMPVVAEDGTKIMSLNLLVDDEESPVVWRGPVLAGTVKQFWHDVCWGNVDYMFVDMPPGTGDVPLTVFQSLPVDGIVIVTSPQELVQMIVKKAVNMANMMNVPILGVVENYSYIKCPDCGKEIAIFGKSNIEEVAKASNMEVLGKLPLDPSFAEKADCGRFFDLDIDYLSKAYDALKAL